MVPPASGHSYLCILRALGRVRLQQAQARQLERPLPQQQPAPLAPQWQTLRPPAASGSWQPPCLAMPLPADHVPHRRSLQGRHVNIFVPVFVVPLPSRVHHSCLLADWQQTCASDAVCGIAGAASACPSCSRPHGRLVWPLHCTSSKPASGKQHPNLIPRCLYTISACKAFPKCCQPSAAMSL